MSDFATPWTVAHQAPLSMGFSRVEYWRNISTEATFPKSDPVLVKGCVDNFYLLNSSGSFVPDAPYFVLEDPNLAIQRRQWHPTPVLLPGKSHGRRSLVGSVHGVAKSWTRLSRFTFTFHLHTLEKEMATHSSVLAWRIPGMGEPGGLPSLGLHRVGHDWSDLTAAYI